MRKLIKALNIATGETFCFEPTYRCGFDASYIHAPPFFTDEDAFNTIVPLCEARIDDTVFIEWHHDRFYELDEDSKEYVPGSTVWRKSRVIGHMLMPDPKEDEWRMTVVPTTGSNRA